MTVTTNFNPWLPYRKQNPQAKLRLFCFPYAGGSASIYRDWARDLPSSIEVLPVQFPGREMRLRETPFTRMSPLVEAASEALMPYFDVPFCFFGHSMGAWVSFELARLLRRADGITPIQLFVSGRQAPQVTDRDPPKYNLSDEKFLEEIRRLNGVPAEVLESRELMELMMPVLRADYEVIDTYEYADEPPLPIPIIALGGIDDEEDVPHDSLKAWKSQTDTAFSLHMFAGNHFFLHTSKHHVLQTLSKELEALSLPAT